MHDHDALNAGLAPLLGSAGGLELVLPVFLVGLLGGLTHCAGMCGPFVLAQVGARLDGFDAARYAGWRRLQGAALIPYHLGRLTTYVVLGQIAGGLGSLVVDAMEFRWPLALFLFGGALLLAAQAGGWRGVPRLAGLEAVLSPIARPLIGDPRGVRSYGLGVTLGLLPCGLVYGVLATAAGSGSLVAGGAVMAAFGLGTLPALIGVGWGGALLGARFRSRLGTWARPLLMLNALALGAIAVRALAAG